MSSNSLNLTNIKDAIYNNLYLINEDGGVDNIKDYLLTASGDLSGVMAEINKKAPKQNPEFTGTITGCESTDKVVVPHPMPEEKKNK